MFSETINRQRTQTDMATGISDSHYSPKDANLSKKSLVVPLNALSLLQGAICFILSNCLPLPY